jgi:accessory gene regulator protein AgrB
MFHFSFKLSRIQDFVGHVQTAIFCYLTSSTIVRSLKAKLNQQVVTKNAVIFDLQICTMLCGLMFDAAFSTTIYPSL